MRGTVSGRLTALLLSLLTAMCLLAGCAPWEDAVAVFRGLNESAPSESEAIAPAPSPTPAPDTAVQDALGIVINGHFDEWPEQTIYSWLTENFPGGDWACTAGTVEYLATVLYYRKEVEVRFAFRVDVEAGSWELDTCEVSKYVYYEDELSTLLKEIHK